MAIENYPLGDYLKDVREARGLGIRELCRNIEKSTRAGTTISPAYYSQVENGKDIRPEKISFDFFWAVAVGLQVDPVHLWILSRPNIPQDLVDPERRRVVFGM